MDLTQIPDPYKALGVPKDAEQSLIKSTYRKLVLKCHPDKVTDESLKQQKQEEFHKIQQAYEVIGDEAKRERYNDAVKLEALQKERMARNRGAAAESTSKPAARYETRTQAPASSARYEDYKPSPRSYDDRSDRHYEERTRSYDTYEAYPKHSSPRSSREKHSPTKSTRASTDRTRSDYKKARDKDERRERDSSRRYVSVESDSSADEKARYEADYRRRTEEARRQKDEEEFRRAAADARRKTYEGDKYDRYDRHDIKHKDAVNYIQRSKIEPDRPAPPSRTTSSRDVRPEYYARREPRRSSARPTKDRLTSSGRDRTGGIEIVDWEDDRKMPSFKQSSSSPADIRLPPQRSYTDASRDTRRTAEVSPPPMRRSETMPMHGSSRRKEAVPSRSSGLREPAASSAAAYASAPTSSPSATRKIYTYTTGAPGGVREETNGRRTVLHEPSRFRNRSPEPIGRPPMGPNRPVEVAASYSSAAPKFAKPSLGRAATMNVNPSYGGEERGRRLYGEVGSDAAKRENARRQTSFPPEEVSYASTYGPEDVRWAPRSREQPGLSRQYTSVY